MYDQIKVDMDTLSAEYLFRKVKKTAKTKFNCEDRLYRHVKISFYVVHIVSVLLIINNVISFAKSNADYGAIISLVCSICILVYTLVLNSLYSKDDAKSMNLIGTKLLHLADRIQPYCGTNIDLDSYNKFAQNYADILAEEKHNSLKIDYELMKLDFKEYYNLRLKNIAIINVKYCLGFFHYFLAVAAVLFVLIFFYKGC
jgi:hypothetical protein